MADVIAAHTPIGFYEAPEDEPDTAYCQCGAEVEALGAASELYAAHVAEELAKAGYGIVPNVAPEYGARVMQVTGWSSEPHPQGPSPSPHWFNKSTHVRLVGPWQEIKELPDALRGAAA